MTIEEIEKKKKKKTKRKHEESCKIRGSMQKDARDSEWFWFIPN